MAIPPPGKAVRSDLDRVFELHKQAYEYFQARKHMGKVVIAGD
ncbi:MAG: hypothetical protein AAAC50_02375 [Rhizobium altiplani]